MTHTNKLKAGNNRDKNKKGSRSLLEGPPKVINLGLESFAHQLKDEGIELVHVDWSPPAQGDIELASLLSKLSD